MIDTIDDQLLTFATERQKEYVEALRATDGNLKKAARKCGVFPNAIRTSIASLRARAAKQGYSPEHEMTQTVPDGYLVKGTSTLFKEGKPVMQWVKSSIDPDRQAALMQAAFEAMAQDLPRLKKSPRSSVNVDPDLLTVYTLTDSHVGALCWHKEGGADWDLSIAEEVLTGCFMQMVDQSPASGTAVVAQLGDFLHQDSIAPVTPTSGHILDADGRYSKVVRVAIRILRRVIDYALAKHDKVVVLLAEGNHDISSSIWMRVMFSALYENEPRVQVIDSELPYYVWQHGKTMLAWHHGHLKKMDDLPLLFAAQFPGVWGQTLKRYCHVGHRHHAAEKEYSGMKVLQHSTLAARDAYAARGGWMSEREVLAVTYHKEHGQRSRVVITPEMVGGT